MINKYYYNVYGLNIESDIVLSQLTVIQNCDKADVFIKKETLPETIHKSINDGNRNYFTKEEIWFAIDKVAIYRIINGQYISVEDISGTADDLKAFLLGSAFGCLFIQRDIVAIHGAALEVENNGIIITGDMGAGKSTLTSAFISKGYKFLSDDVSVITEEKDGINMINPSYPSRKLCRDTALRFGFDVNNLEKTDKVRDKFFVPSDINFKNEKIPINNIFEIEVKEDCENKDIEIAEIKGIEKLNALIRNIYRVQIALKLGINPFYLKKILSIAKKINYYKIRRPKKLFTVDKQIEQIYEKLKI